MVKSKQLSVVLSCALIFSAAMPMQAMAPEIVANVMPVKSSWVSSGISWAKNIFAEVKKSVGKGAAIALTAVVAAALIGGAGYGTYKVMTWSRERHPRPQPPVPNVGAAVMGAAANLALGRATPAQAGGAVALEVERHLQVRNENEAQAVAVNAVIFPHDPIMQHRQAELVGAQAVHMPQIWNHEVVQQEMTRNRLACQILQERNVMIAQKIAQEQLAKNQRIRNFGYGALYGTGLSWFNGDPATAAIKVWQNIIDSNSQEIKRLNNTYKHLTDRQETLDRQNDDVINLRADVEAAGIERELAQMNIRPRRTMWASIMRAFGCSRRGCR